MGSHIADSIMRLRDIGYFMYEYFMTGTELVGGRLHATLKSRTKVQKKRLIFKYQTPYVSKKNIFGQ